MKHHIDILVKLLIRNYFLAIMRNENYDSIPSIHSLKKISTSSKQGSSSIDFFSGYINGGPFVVKLKIINGETKPPNIIASRIIAFFRTGSSTICCLI